jgi:hypothetical protein
MTRSVNPVGCTGREVIPLVEGRIVSCKMDLGASQGWAGSGEEEAWEPAAGCEPGERPGEDPKSGP